MRKLLIKLAHAILKHYGLKYLPPLYFCGKEYVVSSVCHHSRPGAAFESITIEAERMKP